MRHPLFFSLISASVVSAAFTANKRGQMKVSAPFVINTWAFDHATMKAWEVINSEGKSCLDAVTAGCSVCEEEQCDGTVGYGGSPDENGETTLDAMIFDGTKMDMGAVAGLRNVKNAAAVARTILDCTDHSILVGSLAETFALQMGFQRRNLSTTSSLKMWSDWKSANCQPNFWKNVVPEPTEACGPYQPSISKNALGRSESGIYDTISMVAVDSNGEIAAGTSSNGAKFKIPGRIGDAAIPGAGAYADTEVGAAVATGDGDVMMRFLPSFLIVELMRNGMGPQEAAEEAISRIGRYYPRFSGAVIAVSKDGEFSAACHGIEDFPFTVASKEYGVFIHTVKCIGSPTHPSVNMV